LQVFEVNLRDRNTIYHVDIRDLYLTATTHDFTASTTTAALAFGTALDLGSNGGLDKEFTHRICCSTRLAVVSCPSGDVATCPFCHGFRTVLFACHGSSGAAITASCADTRTGTAAAIATRTAEAA